MRDPLTPFEQQLILSSFPAGSEVVWSMSFPGHNKRYPLRTTVRTPDGRELRVVLRQDDKPGGSHLEATLLPVLARLGLPVPTVLAGPTADPAHADSPARIVFSLLTGTDLLRTCWDATASGLAVAATLTLEAIDRVHGLTDAVAADPVSAAIPRHTLADEARAIADKGGPWLAHRPFADALRLATKAVADIDTPLAFSTGDPNPGNFLTDGERVTGYVDFAWACFEDPHAGIARFWLNDWYPLNKVGLVEKYLYRHNLTRADFAPRLAVRGLALLQADHAPAGDRPDPERDHVLTLVRDATRDLG